MLPTLLLCILTVDSFWCHLQRRRCTNMLCSGCRSLSLRHLRDRRISPCLTTHLVLVDDYLIPSLQLIPLHELLQILGRVLHVLDGDGVLTGCLELPQPGEEI